MNILMNMNIHYEILISLFMKQLWWNFCVWVCLHWLRSFSNLDESRLYQSRYWLSYEIKNRLFIRWLFIFICRWSGRGLGTWQVVLDRFWCIAGGSFWSRWSDEESDYLIWYWQATSHRRLPSLRVSRSL